MNSYKALKTFSAAGILCAGPFISQAVSADTNDNSWSNWVGEKAYLGIGAAAAKLDNAKVQDNNIATGDLSDFSDDRVTGQLYGGIMFNSWLGVEVGYLHLPEYDDNGFDIDGHGISAALLLAAPVGDSMEFYVKGGQVWWDIEVDGPLGFDAKIDGEDWLYGAGVNFAMTDNLALRLEYTRYELDGGDGSADLDTAMLGVQYRF
jgi:opacity protein-like surface antigen